MVGAVDVARASGIADIITFDMGGTSTDVAGHGRPRAGDIQHDIGAFRCSPSVDLHTIGAGGGSLAWVVPAASPSSGHKAPAPPGPRLLWPRRSRPTMSDANLLLGRLNPVALLGGQMPIDAAAASAAITRHIGDRLGIDVERAAAGILQIANVGITGAVRVISVERGEDPPELRPVRLRWRRPAARRGSGGGDRHRRVIVPPHPGLMSAIGLLAADLSRFGLTCLTDATTVRLARPSRPRWRTCRTRAHAWAAESGNRPGDPADRPHLELRYRGQSSELRVASPMM